MSEPLDKTAARSLSEALERVRTRLHEVEVNAPPQVYQAIERLREITQQGMDETEQRLSHLAHELGETEEDLIEWLRLDLRALERRLLSSLIDASDHSRAELRRWLMPADRQKDEEED